MNEFEKVLKVVEENTDLKHIKINSINETVKQKYYNLGGYLIFESDEGVGWVTVVDMGKEHGGLMDYIGRCLVFENDSVIFLSAWKDNDFSKFETKEKAEEYIDSLPKWDKTKYYLKMVDFGENTGLRDCKTSELVDKEVCERILPKHGFIKKEDVQEEKVIDDLPF